MTPTHQHLALPVRKFPKIDLATLKRLLVNCAVLFVATFLLTLTAYYMASSFVKQSQAQQSLNQNFASMAGR